MKNLLTLLLLASFITFSCEDSLEEQSSASLDQPEVGKTSLNGRIMDPNDPNLDPDWQWWVPGNHKAYIFGSEPEDILLPFFSQGNVLNTIEKDMYPEDGWVLVARDFGTPNSPVSNPFLILYNKYRGILRYMVYNGTREKASYQALKLSFNEPQYASALFTFHEQGERVFTNNFDQNVSETQISLVDKQKGWAVGDFNLAGYDPSISRNEVLKFSAITVDETQLNIVSNEFTLNGYLEAGGPSTDSGLKKGKNAFKSLNDLRKGIKESKLDQSTIDKILNTPYAQAVPFIGGALGIVNAFLGSKKTYAPRQEINLKGNIELQGTSALLSPLVSINLYLKDSGQPNDGSAYKPINNIPWGVFNLSAKPTFRQDLYIGYYQSEQYPGECESDHLARITAIDQDINFTSNHSRLGMSLTSKKLKFLTSRGTPINNRNYVGFDQLNTLNIRTVSYTSSVSPKVFPKQIGIELVYKINAPTRYLDDEIIIYKAYPVNITEREFDYSDCY